MKVRDITSDSLWISYSSYNYNGIISTLDPNDGFYTAMYAIHKNGILDLYNSGELIIVMRDYSPSSGFDREIEYFEPDSLDIDLDSLDIM